MPFMHPLRFTVTILLGFVALFMTRTGAHARQDTVLEHWQFHLGDVPEAAPTKLAPGDWETVSLPHNWGWEQAQRGETYYRGPGWYRRELVVDAQPGRRYFLRFEAAASAAVVYLNDRPIGEHRGAFGAFCFEITTNLSGSNTNLLAVRVSNAVESDIAPLAGDFNVYGGLYRPVHLVETADECLGLTDHASPGVSWLQSEVGATHAVLDVTAQISSGSAQSRTLDFITKIVTPAGEPVRESKETVTLAPAATAPHWSRLIVAQPHLWNGRRDPFCYRAIVELRSTNGILIDSVEQSLGLRSYRVDPDKGFFLNGKPYPIHGVCRHQDRFGKGWAISESDTEEDLALIKEMGATAVRCAHYQHSDLFYTLCDRAGILVWAEIPLVNDVENHPRFAETARNQLLDLLRQNVNHPSIFAWSLFNEIGNGHTDDPHRLLQDLNNLAHSEDPSRPTIAATCTPKFPQMNKITDLLGWNIYPGWYGGKDSLVKFSEWLEAHRFAGRQEGFCISEYGAGANIDHHEDAPLQPKTTGQWHPEEWQALVHEQDWAAIKARPFVWGSFVWNMFDFCAADRREGGQVGLNDKGLVSFDRRTKKDAFYFYQANWSAEPSLHITSRRFVERTNAVTDIKIYSNAEAVELRVNDVSLGTRQSDGNAVFIWKGCHLRPGDNHIEAQAERNGAELKDQCVWKFQ